MAYIRIDLDDDVSKLRAEYLARSILAHIKGGDDPQYDYSGDLKAVSLQGCPIEWTLRP